MTERQLKLKSSHAAEKVTKIKIFFSIAARRAIEN